MKNVNKMHKELGLKEWTPFKRGLLKDPEVKKAYNEANLEYKLRELIITERIKKNVTQKSLAKKMKTTQSVISRFEAGKVTSRIDFIQRFMDALGLKLQIVAK